MISRRLLCCGAAALPLAAVAQTALAQDCAVYTKDRQKAVSLEDAISLLKAGNQRFIAGKSINCNLMQQVQSHCRRAGAVRGGRRLHR